MMQWRPENIVYVPYKGKFPGPGRGWEAAWLDLALFRFAKRVRMEWKMVIRRGNEG